MTPPQSCQPARRGTTLPQAAWGGPWEGSRGLGNCTWHFHTPQVSSRSCPGRDFPDSPMIRALCFQCKGREVAPWSPASHVVQEQKKKKWDKASSSRREEEGEHQG